MTNNNHQKMRGRIIRVSKAGWGFISSREIEFTQIFFHWTALQRDTLSWKELKTGMHCEFEPSFFPGKGYRALRVRILEKDNEETQLPLLSE